MQHALTEQPPDAARLAREEARDARGDRVDRDEPRDDEEREHGAGEVHHAQVSQHGPAERDIAADHEQPEDDREVEQPLRDDDPDRA